MKLVTQQQQQHTLQQPPIRQEKEIDVFTVVKASVAKAILDLNWKEPSDVEYLTKELTRRIGVRFPSIRLVEIPKAIEKGIRKEFGEYHGLSVVNFENFIACYLKSPERLEMGKEIAKLAQPKEPSLDERFNVAKSNALTALEAKKNLQIVTASAVSVYNFLDTLNLIPFNSYEKRQFVEDAKEELKTVNSFQASIERDKAKRNALVSFLERLSQNQEPDAVKSRAKRIAVNTFLAQCILDEVDLPSLIEEKRDFYKTLNNK